MTAYGNLFFATSESGAVRGIVTVRLTQQVTQGDLTRLRAMKFPALDFEGISSRWRRGRPDRASHTKRFYGTRRTIGLFVSCVHLDRVDIQ